MLNSIKAISFGILTIIILGLVNQLVLILSLVAYSELAKTYSVLQPWSQVFTYALGALGYFIVMFFGGLTTSAIAQTQPYIKSMIAAFLGSSFSLYLSLKDEIFTPIALVFIVFGILSTLFGCWAWKQWKNKTIQQKYATTTPSVNAYKS